LGLVAAVGIAPVFWMQWQRPFYIFSLLAIALQPTQLSDEQRRLLRLFKTKEVRVLTAIAPVILTIALWQLYKLAPLAAEVTPFSGRLVGLLVAAIAFLGCNLFLQVPFSVVRVLLAGEAELAATDPYLPEQIGRDFTVLGLRVKQILPAIAPPPPPIAVADGSSSEPETGAAASTAIATSDAGESAPVVKETISEEVILEKAILEKAIPEEVSQSDAATDAATDTATVTAAEESGVEEAIASEAVSQAEAASVVEEQVAEEAIEELLEGRSPDA
ncbi:MAG: low-complexity tail membrane protein, partial [Leptolyngbyaceae cyanobacterium SL_5_9]|nr:low-complexity tail membrane protein [Leptolyngbyaceae cyanobacterium SL_5_9]